MDGRRDGKRPREEEQSEVWSSAECVSCLTLNLQLYRRRAGEDATLLTTWHAGVTYAYRERCF